MNIQYVFEVPLIICGKWVLLRCFADIIFICLKRTATRILNGGKGSKKKFHFLFISLDPIPNIEL